MGKCHVKVYNVMWRGFLAAMGLYLLWFAEIFCAFWKEVVMLAVQ